MHDKFILCCREAVCQTWKYRTATFNFTCYNGKLRLIATHNKQKYIFHINLKSSSEHSSWWDRFNGHVDERYIWIYPVRHRSRAYLAWEQVNCLGPDRIFRSFHGHDSGNGTSGGSYLPSRSAQRIAHFRFVDIGIRRSSRRQSRWKRRDRIWRRLGFVGDVMDGEYALQVLGFVSNLNNTGRHRSSIGRITKWIGIID